MFLVNVIYSFYSSLNNLSLDRKIFLVTCIVYEILTSKVKFSLSVRQMDPQPYVNSI